MAQSNDDAVAQRRSQEYPEDRFDHAERSGRVGAHRVIAKPRHFWLYVIAGVLGFVLLTCVGVLVVQSVGGKGITPTAEQTEASAPKTPAVLDPAATVAVFNGSPDLSLGAGVAGAITAEGWGQVMFSENLAESDVPISAVFYRDAADEEAARGLAEKLGGVSTYLTEDYAEYGARLIVLLGVDYAGPGAGAAVAEEPPVAEEGTPAPEETVEEVVADPSQMEPAVPAE